MLDQAIITMLQPLIVFGGIAGVIGAFGWARAESIRAKGRGGHSPASEASSAVLAELKALKHQINEMQSTGHQFDISFDAALARLEQRVSHLETKTAAPSAPLRAEEPRQTVGRS